MATENAPWHALPADAALRKLQVNPQTGLSDVEVENRRASHGPNALPQETAQPMWRVFLRQFESPLIYILLAAAVGALLMGHHSDAIAILAVVVGNALIGSLQEGRAEHSMAALRRLATVRVRVLRAGAEQTIEASALVPGDIVLFAAGDAVCADARLLDQAQLQVAEAALTGESLPVAKRCEPLAEATSVSDRHNMLYSGTQITAGRGTALVVATGVHTEVGRIAGLTVQAQEPPTPLEQRIAQFGRWLVAAAVALFVVVLGLGLWRELPLTEVLMVAISQMVSMVPEGLPVALTVALAVGMQRMAGQGAIIRRLSAVETLGSTTVICTDKTGTLTRNEMTVVRLWLPGGRRVDVSGTGYAPQGAFTENDASADLADPALQALLRASSLCNDAQCVPPTSPGANGKANENGNAQWSVLGDPTEGALQVLALKAGLDVQALRDAAPREADLPFDAETRLMATRHRTPDQPRLVYLKGAPESVFDLLAADQQAQADAARTVAETWSSEALRVLAVAQVDDDALDPGHGYTRLAGRVRLLGLVAQIDPPRDEVRAVIAQCREAGVRTLMITGDHQLTGLAIARSLGLARPQDRAVSGAELEHMGEEELLDQIDGIAVFARVQPAQKLRIVEALQARGDVVAMTGDGVNDAPALARADVGLAMGITGTEVAKSAAKVVITDDNFATVVAAIRQGRVVYANIKKVILYLFATSIDEVVILILALMAGFPMPLVAVQILWINIVTEATLTVNLVMDPPSGREMLRPPLPRNDPLIDRTALLRILLMSSTAVVVSFGWFAWRLGQGLPVEQVRSETFTLMTMCQWFNAINCQSALQSALRLGALRNRWLVGGLLLSVLLQGLVLYVPLMQTLFQTEAIPLSTLATLVGAASLVLWTEELRKGLARRWPSQQPA